MSILSWLFRKSRMPVQIDQAMHVAIVPTALYLIQKYKLQHGDEVAAALASAVANTLFGLPPANDIGRKFLDSHKSLVENALHGVRSEPEICRIVSVFAHVRANIAGNTASLTGEQLQWIAKLDEAGVLLPIEQVQMPTSTDDLLRQAHAFDLSVMSRLAAKDA